MPVTTEAGVWLDEEWEEGMEANSMHYREMI